MNEPIEPSEHREPDAVVQPAHWRISVSLAATLTVALLLVWSALLDWRSGGHAIPYLGSAVVLSGLFPLFKERLAAQANPEGRPPIPFLPLVGIVYALYFGLPVLLGEELLLMGRRLDSAPLVDALRVALAGWWSLLAGFYILGPRLCWLHPMHLPTDTSRTRPFAVGLIVVGLGFGLVELPDSFGQIAPFLRSLADVGLGLLALLALRGKLSRTATAALWFVAIPASMFMRMGSDATAAVVFFALFLLMLTWACGRRVPWFVLAVGALGVILLRGSAEEFRSVTKVRDLTGGISATDRSFLQLGTVTRQVEMSGTGEVFDAAVELMAARTAHIALLARVVERTPDLVPFWGGETYQSVLASVIPRVLWPNKVKKEVGQDFGHRYGLLNHNDFTTSTNLPQLVEMYANFGMIGVLLGMALIGLIYHALYAMMNAPGLGDGTILLAAMIFSRLINIESDFSLVFGSVLHQIILLALVLRFLRPATRPSSQQTESLAGCTGQAHP